MNVMRVVALLLTVTAASACGSSEPSSPANTESPAASPAAAPAGSPRVFFVEPQDGATVKSPVVLRFGIENYELAPVPPGDPQTSRPGMGHHHVGVDQDCLPAGTVIVRGTPSWVHFGDGRSQIEMQLTPGPHKLSLQLGDDQHRTIDNLCQTITVNVTE